MIAGKKCKDFLREPRKAAEALDSEDIALWLGTGRYSECGCEFFDSLLLKKEEGGVI
jgi:hypothetical protein